MTIEEAKEKKRELERILEDDIDNFIRNNEELNVSSIQFILREQETHCGIWKTIDVIATVTL